MMEDLKEEIKMLNAEVIKLKERVEKLENNSSIIPKFIGTEEIRESLGISHNTVTKLLKEIPSVKIGNKYRINVEEFKKWLDKKQGMS